MENIIVTVISSACILIGTIVSVIASNSKIRAEMEIKQQFQQQQIDEMKNDIKEHNNYAKQFPVIQTELNYIKQSIEEIKNEIKQ